MLNDQHVRVDVLYRNFNKKEKAKIEIINILFFVMPLSIYLIYISQNFVGISWEVQEISRDSGAPESLDISCTSQEIPTKF